VEKSTFGKLMSRPIIELPLVTLSTYYDQRAKIEVALQEYGAMLLALSDEEAVALDGLARESRRFFQLAAEAKEAYTPASLSDWSGYLRPRSSGLDGEGDDFERIAVTPTMTESPQVSKLARGWPTLYEAIHQVFDLLIDKCRQLNCVLSDIIETDPNGSDRAWFDEHSSKLAINYYPRSTVKAMAAHKDFGGLSIVYAGSDSSGLELTDRSGNRWLQVEGTSPSTAIALLGELYSYWTDGLWTAAPHRVASPCPGRISITLFHTPNRQAELSTATGIYPRVLVESFLSEVEQRYLRIR
jgi:isopenicillin N synthase-like dioxygenase